MAETPLLASFDPGNSDTTLMLHANHGAEQHVTFPSLLGSGSLNELRRIRGGAGQDQFDPDEYVLTVDGRTYFAGRLAVEQSADADSARGDTSRYWSGHTRRLLLVAAGALLPRHPHATLRLVTGLPVAVWSTANVQRVQRALCGTHTFTLNERSFTRTIETVAVLMEGAGALAVHGLADDAPQAVIDIGGRTTDLFAAHGMRPLLDRCAGLPIGVEKVTDLLQRQFLEQHGRELRPDELRDVLRSYLDQQPHRALYVAGQKVAVHNDLENIIASVADEIARFVGQTWRSGERAQVAADAARVLLIGGGAYSFGSYLQKLIPHLTIPAQPELANVQGYLAFGARLRDADWARLRR
jgi:hypothetical protein